MKSFWIFCLLASIVVIVGLDRASAQGKTLLSDNFTKDSSLDSKLWTKSSNFLKALASASSSPPASFVSPHLSFSSKSGMRLEGPTEDYETTAVQSLETFKPPFTVVTFVTVIQGTADIFEIFLTNSDLTKFLTVTGDANSTYEGIWATAQNVSDLWQLGEEFSPAISLELGTTYQVTIKVGAQGDAIAIVENTKGTVLSSISNLRPGTGPFYLVLGQRIGDAPAGTQVADWSSVSVSTP